jgi:UDP-N-acetylmuramoyl-L-alanyl-D-glutamate--2,6-diaminopimelate ligase
MLQLKNFNLRCIKSPYHYMLALAGALLYRFPSRKLTVVAITGTKGKTSVSEILNAIFERAGFETALSNGIRFKIGAESERNNFKMTMPGRMFLQKFLRNSVNKKCNVAIIEMTSEGAAQHRHKFISMDALIFTNLAPEHIESHGSYEAYLSAKLKIARSLERSRKKNKAIIANSDDKAGRIFLKTRVQNIYPYNVEQAEPCEVTDDGISFKLDGKTIHSSLKGLFNLYNCLAAASAARHFGVPTHAVASAIENFKGIDGRMQYIEEGQAFRLIVDYAHTPDSLKAVYEFLNQKKSSSSSHLSKNKGKIICLLGSTGGGRDKWKRPEMGRIAGTYCDKIILTDEDPYDENPQKILDDIKAGISEIKMRDTTIELDRRKAMQEAISTASAGDTVIITGKGTDPYIMGPEGAKTPWSDAEVAREILKSQNR